MQNLALNFSLNPTFNVQAFNAILSQVKQSLGAMGDTIKPIDEAKFNASIQSIRDKAKQAAGSFDGIAAGADNAAKKVKGTSDETEKLKTKAGDLKSVFGSGLGAMALGFNQTMMATQALANGLGKIIDASEEYQKNLLAVGAFTGTTGDALDALGSKARAVGKSFGTTGAEQLTIFSSVLSKMGPSYAQNADAMQKFATNANTLAKAGGLDLATSVEVMNNSMLMFGLRTGNAAKDAETSTRVINGIAASARAGAAPIAAVGESILQAGVMAKSSKVSFEETAAAIQVLSVGGKTGSEAGVALRNVLGLLQKPSAEAEAGLRKMGLTGAQLADTLTNKGIGAALTTLRDGMSKLSTDAERNNVSMKLFGMENASSAGILMSNMDRYDEFLTSIKLGQEGVGTAFEMAAQKSGTATSNIKKMKAWVTDMWVSGGEAIGSYGKTILMASTQVAPMIMSFSALGPAMGKIVGSAANLGLTLLGKVVPAIGATIAANTAAGVSGVAAFSSMAVAVWAAMAPLLPFIAAIGVIGVGLYALAGGFAKTTEEKLKDTEASIQNIEKQKAYNQKLQEQEKSNIRLIAVYEELVKRRSALKAEGKDISTVEDQLNSVMEKLNGSYPETINLTASHEENLRKIKEQTGMAGVETKKFTEENQKLVKEYESLGKKEKLSNTEKERMKVVTAALQKEFPGAIEGAKGFGEGLDILKTQAGLSNNALKGLVKELSGFAADTQRLTQIQSVQKRDIIKDKLYKEFTSLGTAWGTSSRTALSIVTDFYSQLYKVTDKNKIPDLTRNFRETLKDNKFVDQEDKNKAEQAIIELGQAQVAVLESYAQKKQDINDESNAKLAESDKTVYEQRKKTIEGYAKTIEDQGGIINTAIKKTLAKFPNDLSNDLKLTNLTQAQFTELNGMVQDLLKKQKKAHEVSADSRLKTENDLAKATEKLQKELEDKQLELSAKSIKEQSQREYKELEIKYKKELDKYTEQINILENKKKEMTLTADNKAEIDKQIDILKKTMEAQKQIQEKDVESFYKKILDEENKRSDEITKKQSEINKARLEYLKSNLEFTSSTDQTTSNLKAQSKIQIDLAKADADEKINQVLRQDEAYKNLAANVQKWELMMYASKNQPQLRLVANANLTLAEAALQSYVDKAKSSNEQIVLINKQTDKDIAKFKSEEFIAINKARINSIQDAAVRERELIIAEAEIAYNEELRLAKGNHDLEYIALVAFLKKKQEAQQQYTASTNLLSIQAAQFLSAFNDNVKSPETDELQRMKEETLNRRSELKQQEDDLRRSHKNNEISSKDYYGKLATIQSDYKENEKEIIRLKNLETTSNKVLQATELGLLAATKQMYDSTANAIKIHQEKYITAQNSIADIDTRLSQIQNKSSEDYTKLLNTRTIAEAAVLKESAIINAQWALQIGASAGMALAEHKSVGKALLTSMFNFLQSMVPIWSAQILGLSLASAESVATWGVAGLTKFALLTGMMTVAVQTAKAAALSGFFTGGWTGNGDKHAPAGIVHGQEFVMDHRTTALNRPDFEIMQRNKMSLESYVLGFRPDITSKIAHEAVMDELALHIEQKAHLQEMLNEARKTNDNLAELIEITNQQREEITALLAEGNYKRKTLNQVDVDIHLDDNKLLKEVEKRSLARLKRI
jgi:TP901 family phage tail tape measure protein